MPDILKILFRGTKADLGLIERIRAQGHPTLEAFWKSTIGVSKRNGLLGSGNGYQTLKKSSRKTSENADGQPGMDASILQGMPELSASSFTNIFIDTSSLEKFSLQRVHRVRQKEIFTGPLVIVHKSPPSASGRINVAITENSVVFNETFYGYSLHGQPHAKELVRYIALILGSKVTLWLSLITRGEFGFEREVVEKTVTLDKIPFPDFQRLTEEKRKEAVSLFERLRFGTATWEDVDEWAARLYGLGARDLQIIYDTLEFNLPFTENRKQAQAIPSSENIKQFCSVLTEELLPWTKRFNQQLSVSSIPTNTLSPWYGIVLTTNLQQKHKIIDEWGRVLKVADEMAASEVIVRTSCNELLIGRLAQGRYWSNTQARLLAQRIIWSYIDLLKGRV